MHRLTGFLHHLNALVQQFAERGGGPGLALVAFLDSSFLSLPEVSDILIVYFVIRNPEGWPYYAAMTTLGSIAGCYALYMVAKKGGEAALRRRLLDTFYSPGEK